MLNHTTLSKNSVNAFFVKHFPSLTETHSLNVHSVMLSTGRRTDIARTYKCLEYTYFDVSQLAKLVVGTKMANFLKT